MERWCASVGESAMPKMLRLLQKTRPQDLDETFKVHPGDYESIYANMPTMGLAAAGTHVSVSEARDAARQRMSESAA